MHIDHKANKLLFAWNSMSMIIDAVVIDRLQSWMAVKYWKVLGRIPEMIVGK